MGLETLIATIVVAVTAGGSWFSGRKAGLSNALTTASDVVGMLATQAGELRTQLGMKELEIERLIRERDALQADLDRIKREGEATSS